MCFHSSIWCYHIRWRATTSWPNRWSWTQGGHRPETRSVSWCLKCWQEQLVLKTSSPNSCLFWGVGTWNLLKLWQVPTRDRSLAPTSLPLHSANTVQDTKGTKLIPHLLQRGGRNKTCLLISMWPSSDKSTEPLHQHGILSPSASTSDYSHDKREGKATWWCWWESHC